MDSLKNKICWIENDNGIITNRKYFTELTSYTNTLFKVHESFENADWTIEPIKSLKQLYKERAQQLRDNYDYLILYLSGGADSVTVLNSFVDNNIWLDEVVINSFPEINKDVLNCNYAKEYLKKKSYSGKITINNIDMRKLNTINEKQLWFKDEDNNFSGLLPGLTRSYIDFFEENNLIQYTRRHGKIGHVFGADVPKLVRSDDAFYCQITYSEFTNFGLHAKSIPFFVPVDFPEVFIKQCHVLAKFMLRTGLKEEKDCKISIRDEFNPLMFSAKTAGRPQNQFLAGSESRLVLDTYMIDDRFKDLYSNSLYKDYLKPRMLKKNQLNLNRSFLIFKFK